MRSRLPVLARSVVVTAAVVLAVVRFAAIDSGSHSVSDTLRPWLIEVAVIAVMAVILLAVIGRLSTRGAKRTESRSSQ